MVNSSHAAEAFCLLRQLVAEPCARFCIADTAAGVLSTEASTRIVRPGDGTPLSLEQVL